MSEHLPYTTSPLATLDEDGTRLGVSFHTPDLSVSCAGLPSERPFLEPSSREAQVSISTTGGGPVTEQDVTLAREIFNAAARYLADCERLHTEQSTDPTRPRPSSRRPDMKRGRWKLATSGGPSVLPRRESREGSKPNVQETARRRGAHTSSPPPPTRPWSSARPSSRTPAIVTLIIFAWRLLAGLVRLALASPDRRDRRRAFPGALAGCTAGASRLLLVVLVPVGPGRLGASSIGPRSSGWSAGGCWPGGGWSGSTGGTGNPS